jgi:hypothetical protein
MTPAMLELAMNTPGHTLQGIKRLEPQKWAISPLHREAWRDKF